jgi:hypothetical protein
MSKQKMMKKLNILSCLVVLLVLMAACEKSLPNYGQTATPNMSAGWWVTFQAGGAPVTPYFFVNTYNTSANTTDSMWVDDLGYLNNISAHGYSTLFWTLGIGANPSFKATAAIQYTALTFDAANAPNWYWTGDTSSSVSVSFFNGKILPKSSKQASGTMADSIRFQVVYSNNPLDTFVIGGNARTGFDEDEH